MKKSKRTVHLPVRATPESGGANCHQVHIVVSVNLWTVTRAVSMVGEANGTWIGHGWLRGMDPSSRVARRWPELQPRAGETHLHVVLAGLTVGSSMETGEGVLPRVPHGPPASGMELGSWREGDGWGGDGRPSGACFRKMTLIFVQADASSSS